MGNSRDTLIRIIDSFESFDSPRPRFAPRPPISPRLSPSPWHPLQHHSYHYLSSLTSCSSHPTLPILSHSVLSRKGSTALIRLDQHEDRNSLASRSVGTVWVQLQILSIDCTLNKRGEAECEKRKEEKTDSSLPCEYPSHVNSINPASTQCVDTVKRSMSQTDIRRKENSTYA